MLFYSNERRDPDVPSADEVLISTGYPKSYSFLYFGIGLVMMLLFAMAVFAPGGGMDWIAFLVVGFIALGCFASGANVFLFRITVLTTGIVAGSFIKREIPFSDVKLFKVGTGKVGKSAALTLNSGKSIGFVFAIRDFDKLVKVLAQKCPTNLPPDYKMKLERS